MTGLRPGVPGDVAAVVAVFQAARSDAMPWLPVLHTTEEDLAFFGGALARGEVVVADDAGVVVGFAVRRPGWLDHLYVRPDRQRTGVGRALLDLVKASQPEGFALWAFARNTGARAFYARQGLTEVEQTDGSGNEERLPDVRLAWPGRRPPVSVVYSDLDGTMVGPYGCFFRDATAAPTLDPGRALVELLTAGVTLVLVSGRTRHQLEEACRVFGADGFVGELGAVLGWERGLRTERQRGETPDDVPDPVVRALTEAGLVDALLDRYRTVLEPHAPWHEGHEADLMVRGQVDTAEVEAWLAEQGYPWLCVLDNGILPRHRLPDGGAPVHVYHVMSRGLSKGRGVAVDLARRGLAAADAVAVGDSLSDLTMAPHVGRLFLVGNGAQHPAVREAASRLPNVTVVAGWAGLGWAQAVRAALGQAEPEPVGQPAGSAAPGDDHHQAAPRHG